MRPHEPPEDLAEPIDVLLRGDTRPLAQALDGLARWELVRIQRVWWEISTLYGCVVGHLDVMWGEERVSYSPDFHLMPMTGGPPREVVDPDALVRDWREALAQPPSRELHRCNMADTLAALRAGAHPLPDAADALLRHHTDLPVDLFDGRQPVGSGEHERPEWEAVLELLPLQAVLSTPDSFDAHVRAGLNAPSLPRRDLCWRLVHLPDSGGG